MRAGSYVLQASRERIMAGQYCTAKHDMNAISHARLVADTPESIFSLLTLSKWIWRVRSHLVQQIVHVPPPHSLLQVLGERIRHHIALADMNGLDHVVQNAILQNSCASNEPH